MDAEELLRRLALNDEKVVRSAVGADSGSLGAGADLDAKTNALVRLAALLSIGAAPRLALAIDYDVEDVAEVWDGR